MYDVIGFLINLPLTFRLAPSAYYQATMKTIFGVVRNK